MTPAGLLIQQLDIVRTPVRYPQPDPNHAYRSVKWISEFALQPLLTQRANDTARNFEYADGAGRVGFISSVSQPFCGDCTRARISSDGKMFTCLFATGSLDLQPWLGEALAPEALAREILARWRDRDDRYSELRGVRARVGSKQVYPTVRMSLVGG